MALDKGLGDVVGMSIRMFNLALLFEERGRLEEARIVLERALMIFEIFLPLKHPLLEEIRKKLNV